MSKFSLPQQKFLKLCPYTKLYLFSEIKKFFSYNDLTGAMQKHSGEIAFRIFHN